MGFCYCAAAEESRGLGRVSQQAVSDSKVIEGKYRAVVIGNNAYTDPKRVWRPLKTAINDAEAVSTLLKEQYGFTEIVLLKNGTRRQILNALNDLRASVKSEDSVLVYYAGHGWRNETTEEAFWIPVDAEGTDDSFYISNVRIKEKLSIIANVASHTLLISDSCFSGSLLDSRGTYRANSSNADNLSYFKKVAKRKSVQILAAGGKEFVDDNYRGSGHSPFTYFMLSELKNNDDPYITLANLAINIEEQVAKNSEQTPQSGAFRSAGDEGGQFIFSRLGAGSTQIISGSQPMLTLPAIQNQTSVVPSEFSDWQNTDQNNATQVIAYINKYPQGTITEVAKLKYQDIMETIGQLLKKAQSDVEYERYIDPPNQNAKERYLAVLKLDSSNEKAKQGLNRLADLLSKKARYLLKKEKFDDAAKIADELSNITPGSNEAGELRKSATIGKLLVSAKKHLNNDRYIEPEDHNAKSDYFAVLELDHQNRDAIQGLIRIAKHLIETAGARDQKTENFSQAESILSYAEKIDPKYKEIGVLRHKMVDKRNEKPSPVPSKAPVDRIFIAPPPSF